MNLEDIGREFDQAVSKATIVWQQAVREAMARMEHRMAGNDPDAEATETQDTGEDTQTETTSTVPDIQIPSRLPGGS